MVIWQHMFSMPVTRTLWSREFQLTAPQSTRYRHTKYMLLHNHNGLIILLNILIELRTGQCAIPNNPVDSFTYFLLMMTMMIVIIAMMV